MAMQLSAPTQYYKNGVLRELRQHKVTQQLTESSGVYGDVEHKIMIVVHQLVSRLV